MELKNHKTCIFGIQGSGKTHWARTNYKQFKHPIVFVVNDDDQWEKLPNLYVYKANRLRVKEDFDTFIKQCRQWALEGKIDAIIIDEADMFFETNWDINPAFKDIVLNHRHLGSKGKEGVALWLITRRPQDIPTKIVESSRYLIIFKLEGQNAVEKFRQIHPILPEMIERLDYEKHNFIFKEIGKMPVIHAPLK